MVLAMQDARGTSEWRISGRLICMCGPKKGKTPKRIANGRLPCSGDTTGVIAGTWVLNCALMCMGINLGVLYASHKKGKTCHMGSPDHLAWLPKVVGRLLALLVILPLARKNKQEVTGGVKCLSTWLHPHGLGPLCRPHGQGASLKPSPKEKGETNKKTARLVPSPSQCVVCARGGVMWPAQLATLSTRQWLVQNAFVHGGGVIWLAQLATLTTRHVLTTGGVRRPHLTPPWVVWTNGAVRRLPIPGTCNSQQKGWHSGGKSGLWVPKLPLRLDTPPTW